MRITNRTAPPSVSGVLKTLSKEEVNWYLAQGEPECIKLQMIRGNDFVTELLPGLRGIIVGEKVDNPEEAITAAARVKENLSSKKLKPIDEITLEIDDEAFSLQEQCDQAMMRLESIAHIGTMNEGSPSEPLEQMLDHIIDGNVDALETLSFLKEYEKSGRYSSEDAEELCTMLRERGYAGFLVEASVPKQVKNGISTSIHYNTRHTNIFYGATFRVAVEKALKWGNEESERMRQKPKAA